ncbi:MAG: hypothetical protein RL141_457 [Candidatus Parcubacteria bacterium]|jgi:large subunit ribosomal protein L18
MNKIQQRMAQSRSQRIARVRSRIHGSATRPRLAVKRTLKHIYAQLIDDVAGRTIASASDHDVKVENLKPLAVAEQVGKLLAERATAQKVTEAVFDRRDKRFHGRVKAVADGARANGLIF